ncbi:MAG TPA: peptide deformylase [Planctomycetota bacterium]|nr:peptide deformylase [Planctomycetota bacterium]
MILPIPPYPSPALRERSREVRDDEFGPELEKLAADMVDTMYHADGVGLAAPQIGRNIRVIVYDISPERNQPHAMVNPRILEADGVQASEEGCLSVPELRGKVRRPARVVVEGRSIGNEPVRLEARGLAAKMFQHEVDHLDGMLFCDRLSAAKRLTVRKHLKKLEDTAGKGGNDSQPK